jgi:GT2 family glycosyltransferase
MLHFSFKTAGLPEYTESFGEPASISRFFYWGVGMVQSTMELSPRVSVIIPVYKGGEDFRLCLNALAEAEPSADEIIVVADGGMDDTPYPEKESGVKVLETPVHGGPSRARNLGAWAAKGEILFFVDADVTVQPDSIRKVENIFCEEADLAAVFGSYDDAPAKPNFLSQYRNLLHHYVHQHGNKDASTFWSGCGAIRRDVFLALGGFDEDQLSIEDIELGYRLKKADYKIQLCKTLQIKHLKRWRIFSMLRTDFFVRALPWTKLILRDHRFINDLNVDTSSRISVMCTFGIVAALFAALWWPGCLIVAAMLSLLLLGLNMPLYRFFQRKRGLWFALKTIPWHWFYFFYSGLAFASGLASYSLSNLYTPNQEIPKTPEKVLTSLSKIT